MRAFKRYARAGFTLVELMIVVAIIGILAALAIYGVRRYLASAKTSEAKNTLGAISRGAIGGYERETTPQELVTEGSTASAGVHDMCADSVAVPDTGGMVTVKGAKYQPNSADTKDYETGNITEGWKCLKHNVTQPQYFYYGYLAKRVDGKAATETPAATQDARVTAIGNNEFVAFAHGDLNGDGARFSSFAQYGQVNTTTKSIKVASELLIVDEYE